MKDIFWLAEGFEAAGGDDDSGSSNDNNIVSAQDNNIYYSLSMCQSISISVATVDQYFLVLPLLIILIVVRFLFTRISMAAPLLPLL